MKVLIQPRGRFQTYRQSIYLDGHSRLAAHVDLTKMDRNQDVGYVVMPEHVHLPSEGWATHPCNTE
jgi:hypothetical protein